MFSLLLIYSLLIAIGRRPIDVIVEIIWVQDAIYVLIILMFTIQGAKKILILHEIPEDGISNFLSNKDCLAACDVAAFVYDRCGAKCFFFCGNA